MAGLLALAGARAQIVADSNAPGRQQATVMRTESGAPLVNIQAPSQAGVSRNVFSQFDVSGVGAILNNSSRQVQTQLAGWVAANPWLAAGTARVILNEVNSTRPSQLNGMLEVAGNTAQVVLANASGITCQGCGFINSAGITLTTGKPQLNPGSGALEGYRVEQGSVAVEGAGLDSGGASYTDIIARAVQVNAGIWAKRLQLAAGSQEVRGGGGIDLQTVERLLDKEAPPPVAIDVALLGGMYAGRIRLLGTADGVGVRNAGQLYAGASELVVSVDGRIENLNAMRAAGGMQLQAQALDNGGSLQTDTGTRAMLAVHTKDGLTNTGLIVGDEVSINAGLLRNTHGGRIYGDRISLQAGQLENTGKADVAPAIAARQRLDIGAASVENREHALLSSEGDLAIGGELDAQGHATGQAQVLTNASASIEAGQDLDLRADSIRNSNEHFSLTTENLPPQTIVEYQGAGSPNRYLPGTPGVYVYNDESDHLQTPEGAYESWSSYVYTRGVSETRVASSEPARMTAGRDMRITGDSLVNDNSQIVAGRGLVANLKRLDNIETPGRRVTSENGVVNNYWRDHKKGRDATGWSQIDWSPPDVVESIPVSPMLFQQNQGPASASDGQSPIFETDADGSLIRGGGIDLRIPTSSLFRPVLDGSSLIETDAEFAGQRNWLGSDYLLSGLSISPEAVQKRLGDGYYEQKLVREQVAQLTGRRFLADASSDEAQYQALMDSGISFAKAHQLVPGVALSAEQMAQLTTDIVWLVEKEIRLADGSTTRALVPQVYVKVRDGDLLPGGALISADAVQLDVGALANGGSIAGRKLVQVDAANISNAGGHIQGDAVKLKAGEDIDINGGSLRAGSLLQLDADGDIHVRSTTGTAGNVQGSVSHIDRMASLYVSKGSGSLQMKAGRDLRLDAAAVASEGDMAISAAHDISLGTAQQGASHQLAWGADNWRHDVTSSEAGTVMLAQGGISMQAGRDLQAQAATVVSNDGAVKLTAGQDLRIVAGSQTQSVDELHVHTGTSGVLSSTTYTQHDQLTQSTARASTIAGRSIVLQSGRDTQVLGSSLAAVEDVTLKAGGNIAVDAATQQRNEAQLRKEETSGIFSTGGLGFSIGHQDQTLERKTEAISVSASSLISTSGNIDIQAGQAYAQRGSDLAAVRGSISIDAGSADIREARQTSKTTVERSVEQSGLTVAVSSPVISAIQTVEQMRDAAEGSRDGRIKALAVANAAMAMKSGVDAVAAGQGKTVDGRANQVPIDEKDSQGTPEMREATVAERMGGINLAISLGQSSSRTSTHIAVDSGRQSSVSAGGDIAIRASGQASDGSLTVQGSKVQAGGQVWLQAQEDIHLRAGRDTVTQQSSNTERSASAGVSIGTDGFLATASLGEGRGGSDGTETLQDNARIVAGTSAALESGRHLELKGAVVEAPQVRAKVGGDLQVQSLQDSSEYDSQQKSVTLGAAVGAGGVRGNVSGGRSRIASRYAGVAEQSGIRALDGGFDVAVQGRTVLVGGAISSTQAAVDAGRNRFESDGGVELHDIANDASYSAKGSSVNFGSSVDPQAKLAGLGTGAGNGSDSGHASSVTQAGVSGIAGNRNVRTGDAEPPLRRIFDLERVQREVNAQVQVTQGFVAQASKEIANYVDARRSALRSRQAAATTEAERQVLERELGDLRLQEAVLHILVGAFTGQGETAVTKESLATTAEKMRKFILEDSKKFPGIIDEDAGDPKPLSNISGISAGVHDDKLKGAGTRINLDSLCGKNNERCKVLRDENGKAILDESGKTTLALNEDGKVVWDGARAGISLEEFLATEEGKDMRGPTGGIQGAVGTIFGHEYAPGGTVDKVFEAFSGPHDYLGGSVPKLYDEYGNIKRGMSGFEQKVYDAYSAVAIPAAAPFAMAAYFSPQVWQALSALIRSAR